MVWWEALPSLSLFSASVLPNTGQWGPCSPLLPGCSLPLDRISFLDPASCLLLTHLGRFYLSGKAGDVRTGWLLSLGREGGVEVSVCRVGKVWLGKYLGKCCLGYLSLQKWPLMCDPQTQAWLLIAQCLFVLLKGLKPSEICLFLLS